MIAYVNGRYSPQETATVSISDRGFLYGDGCFETIAVRQGKPSFWREHLSRLNSGLTGLAIPSAATPRELTTIVRNLIRVNWLVDALIRIQVTRGPGPRGYAVPEALSPSLIVNPCPMPSSEPASRTLTVSSRRLDADCPTHRFKTNNKLLQVLGMIEAEERQADDALFLNRRNQVVETTAANVFWSEGRTVGTPPLNSGALPGIARQIVLDACRSLKLAPVQENITLERLSNREGVFLTQSVRGILPVRALNGRRLSLSPLTERLHREFLERARRSPFP